MSIDLDLFCFDVTLTIMFDAVFSVATNVGGFWCLIYARVVIVDVAF